MLADDASLNPRQVASLDPQYSEDPPAFSSTSSQKEARGTARRVLSLVFPQLLCELARKSPLSVVTPVSSSKRPLAVILADREGGPIKPTHPLSAACPLAYSLGIRPGQSTTEACALVAGLQIEVLDATTVHEKLGFITEVANRYGTSLCSQMPDTVWVDVTGVGHLFGGEEQLVQDAQEQLRSLGHFVRAVIASGPRIGQAVGRFVERSTTVLPRGEEKAWMSELPLSALPLEPERIGWFARLGLFSLGQLSALPAKTLSARLGPQALDILELLQGIDRAPLVPQKFPQVLCEEVEWDEPMDGLSPLLFALRGLVARLSARLLGRGEAAGHLECEIEHDRMIARERGVLSHTLLEFELANPLYRDGDLERIVKSRLERVQLGAPSRGLRLRASELSPRAMKQVGLSAGGAITLQTKVDFSQEFSVLLAELQSDVGPEELGLLTLKDSHLPEQRSHLAPLTSSSLSFKRLKTSQKRQSIRRALSQEAFLSSCPSMDLVTRLLPTPAKIKVILRVGESFGLGAELYTIERLRFIQRLEAVEWWTDNAARRDYFWLELVGLHGHSEALVFIERNSGETYLQGWGD